MFIQSYRDLIVWQKAMSLAEACYLLSRDFPSEERFGLSAQLRRAAVSVPSNLAEGHGTGFRRRFAFHVAIARGSLMEVETQLQLAHRLGYVDETQALLSLTEEISRMLTILRRRLG